MYIKVYILKYVYCGKTKNLTPEIFSYVLDKIFIVNLKKKFLIFGDSFYEFQGQSKGHKVKYLKNYLEFNYECIFGILDEFPLRIYSFYSSMS